jgi:hypothetical protein
MYATYLLLTTFGTFSIANAQPRAMTVCEAQDNSVLSGREVVVEGILGGEPHHGYYIFDAIYPKPCSGWFGRLFVVPPFIGIGYETVQDRQRMSPTLAKLAGAGKFPDVRVRITGIVIKKPKAKIFYSPSPIWSGEARYWGDGWGQDGVLSSRIVVRIIIETSPDPGNIP